MLTFNKIPDCHSRPTTRRAFLQAGAIGGLGLSLPQLLQAAAGQTANASSQNQPGFGRAKNCLLVFLNGGPSQLDTWDMKPNAPAEVRGELQPIATSVPGIQASELLPLLAGQVDKFKIVRSVTHEDTEHTTSMCTMLTGTYHPRPKIAQIAATQADHPHLGAIYAKSQTHSEHLPPFVTLPTLFQPCLLYTSPSPRAS